MSPDEYEPFRVAIRARRHRVTPYRLGYAIAEAGGDLACPYTNRVSIDGFREGLVWGRRARANAKALERTS